MNIDSGYDLFISHASEDKDAFVRQLAVELRTLGVRVWYDEFSLRPGDSLRESIDRGLSSSRHGLVVLSKAFFAKKWTNWEVNGLVQICLDDSSRRIIPLWLDVNHSEIKEWSAPIADLVALKGGEPKQIAKEVFETIEGDDVTYYRLRLTENIDIARTVTAWKW
jgi:hypothetical protein